MSGQVWETQTAELNRKPTKLYLVLTVCNIRPWNFVTFSLCEKWRPEIDLRQQLYLIVSNVGICRFGSSHVWMGKYPSHTTCYCLFFCRPASQFLELPLNALPHSLVRDSQLYFSNLLYTWRLSPCSEIFRRSFSKCKQTCLISLSGFHLDSAVTISFVLLTRSVISTKCTASYISVKHMAWRYQDVIHCSRGQYITLKGQWEYQLNTS